jgi:hypothetical protein
MPGDFRHQQGHPELHDPTDSPGDHVKPVGPDISQKAKEVVASWLNQIKAFKHKVVTGFRGFWLRLTPII